MHIMLTYHGMRKSLDDLVYHDGALQKISLLMDIICFPVTKIIAEKQTYIRYYWNAFLR